MTYSAGVLLLTWGHPREFLAPTHCPPSVESETIWPRPNRHGEVRVRAASGGYRWMNANLGPILDEAGVVIGWSEV